MRFLPIIVKTRSSKKPPIHKLNLSIGSHFEQLQDGRNPDTRYAMAFEPNIIETNVIPIYRVFFFLDEEHVEALFLNFGINVML